VKVPRTNTLRVLFTILLLSPLFASAQTSTPATISECGIHDKLFTPTNPRMTAGGDFIAGQTIVQARMKLDANTSVRIVEYPVSSQTDLQAYNTVIVVERGQQRTRYPLSELIKFGSRFRVVEIASLCTSPQAGVVYFAFETPSTGAEEGFVAMRYSPDFLAVQGFPIANQGRIVVSKVAPYPAELWSATGEPKGAIICNACPKHYRIQDCQMGSDKVECHIRAREVGPFLPEKFTGARIKIH
jgi:hypothetical protein